jgi:hypothetical protein
VNPCDTLMIRKLNDRYTFAERVLQPPGIDWRRVGHLRTCLKKPSMARQRTFQTIYIPPKS